MIRTSPIAWGLAALLLVGGIYWLIRMLEWDLVNHETPDQDDPLGR